VASVLNTVTLFDSNASTMLTANMEFLMQRGVWPTPSVPFGKVRCIDRPVLTIVSRSSGNATCLPTPIGSEHLA
jgi:hypothetical protein